MSSQKKKKKKKRWPTYPSALLSILKENLVCPFFHSSVVSGWLYTVYLPLF